MSCNFVPYKKEDDPELVSRIYDIAFHDEETEDEDFVNTVFTELSKIHSLPSCLLTMNALFECYDFEEEEIELIEDMELNSSLTINNEICIKKISNNLFTSKIITYCDLYNEKNNNQLFFPFYKLEDIKEIFNLKDYFFIKLYYLKINETIIYEDIDEFLLFRKHSPNAYTVKQFFWSTLL